MSVRVQQLQHNVSLIGKYEAVEWAAQCVRLLCAKNVTHAAEPSITDPANTDEVAVAAAVRMGALEALLAALQRSVREAEQLKGDNFGAWRHLLTIRKEVCRTLVVMTNKTARGAHHAVCARAVSAGALDVLSDALREHCRGPEISGDVLRVLAQLLQSQRGAATAEQAADMRELAQSLVAEHAPGALTWRNGTRFSGQMCARKPMRCCVPCRSRRLPEHRRLRRPASAAVPKQLLVACLSSAAAAARQRATAPRHASPRTGRRTSMSAPQPRSNRVGHGHAF